VNESPLRYLFVSTGDLKQNSSFMRLRELGRCLHEYGVDVHYIVDQSFFNDALPSQLSYAHVHRVTGIGRIGRLIDRRRVIDRINPNIVHILNPQISNSATILGCRRFVVVDWDEMLSARMAKVSAAMVSRLCEHWCRRRADLTVVASRHMQKLFREQYGVKSLYLPYATYVEPLGDGEPPTVGPTVAYLGNFHADGDHDILIDAWQELGQGLRVPSLHMLGGGVGLNSVRTQVVQRGLGNVHVHGFRPWPEVWRYLRHADLLIFPIRDSLANRMRCPAKIFAYMQAGRPIITNRVGEVAEALGNRATYVEPTPTAFAAAVREAFQRPSCTVDYDVAKHQWSARARLLLDAVTPLHESRKAR